MDAGGHPELVVNHRKLPAVRLQPEVLRIFRAASEITFSSRSVSTGWLNSRLTTIFFQGWIPCILIKLAVRDFSRKRGGFEIPYCSPASKRLAGQKPLAVKADGEAAVDRPVVFRVNCSFRSDTQKPCAVHRRGNTDSGGDFLFHLLERRGGPGEIDKPAAAARVCRYHPTE